MKLNFSLIGNKMGSLEKRNALQLQKWHNAHWYKVQMNFYMWSL
jgi:hypothetical protein